MCSHRAFESLLNFYLPAAPTLNLNCGLAVIGGRARVGAGGVS